MQTLMPVNGAERRNQDDSAVVGGYMMHSAQSRLAMAKLAFGQQLFTILIAVILAVHGNHFTAVTALVIALCIVMLPVLRLVRWQSLPPLTFIPYLWFSIGVYVLMAFDFNEPDVLLGAFTTATLLASAYWYKPWLMILQLSALLGVFAGASLLIAGRDELATVFLTVPLMALFAIRLGSTSNHYLCMVLRRKRFHATVTSLLHALHARDGYTAEHSEIALKMALGVADQLKLDDDERIELTDIALLHDIGKIGIPNAILHKPGKLDEREWEIMRRHPVIGEQILADVPGFEKIAKAVRHEHERWDGNGYPDGLVAADIPLASRIVLVCDAYHAMTSDRPYRQAMSDDDARAELVRHAGSQFDPLVVTAFLRALDDGLMSADVKPVAALATDEVAANGEPTPELPPSTPRFADLVEAEVDPASDHARMMRSAVEIWLLSVILFAGYLVTFGKVDRFGVAIVCIAVLVGLISMAPLSRRPAKVWYVTTGAAAYVLVTSAAAHFHEPALLLFLVSPATSLAAYFWHSLPAKLLQLTAALVVFAVLPIAMFESDELARALIGTRAFIGAILVVGYFARRMSAMGFERERFASTASSLLFALHARDGYTATHSSETVEMAMKVAERIGLDAVQREELSNIAVLHDIGKIGVPDEILHKPGKLDDVEWEIMRQHPVIGEQIVAQVPGYDGVARAIRHEHERWDGKGYPDGLSGLSIPLASRIVLVCDAFHAMTSDRPYRKRMSDAAARAELLSNAGTQFDPTIVRALIEALESSHVEPVADETDTALRGDDQKKAAVA